jgi:hypothetical protein
MVVSWTRSLWRTQVSQLSEWVSSERSQDHEDLVPGVVGGEPQFAGPASCLAPPESGVEVFESCSAPGSEVELFEAHLVAGDLPELVHQCRADAPAAVCGLGLQVVDGAPMCDEGIGVAAEQDPPGEGIVAAGEQYPAPLRVEAGGEVVDGGRNLPGVDRRKGESSCAAGVGDRDPAVGELLPDGWVGVVRVRELGDAGIWISGHGRASPGRVIGVHCGG